MVIRDETDSLWQSVLCGLRMLLCTHQWLERRWIFSGSPYQRRSRQDGSLCLDAAWGTPTGTEKTSENLYYGLVPSSAGLLSVEKVKQRFKVRDLKVKMKTAWWTKVMNDKSKVKSEKTWFPQSVQWLSAYRIKMATVSLTGNLLTGGKSDSSHDFTTIFRKYNETVIYQ